MAYVREPKFEFGDIVKDTIGNVWYVSHGFYPSGGLQVVRQPLDPMPYVIQQDRLEKVGHVDE